MKTKIAFVFITLFLMTSLHAQTEVLTNASIIKMVQAKLADDLIIDVIKDSQVNFDLSNNGITALKKENVSDAVITAMKSVAPAQPQNQDVKPADQPPSSFDPASAQALGYAAPVAGLADFYGKDYSELSKKVDEWELLINSTIKDINDINLSISNIENNLNEKKNADAKGYSKEILDLKKSLADARTKYKELKSKMLADGEKITEQLSEIRDSKIKSISKEYSEVSQQVKSAVSDPSSGAKTVAVDYPSLSAHDNICFYLAPLNELFYWYGNEITDVRNLITEWNARVNDAIQKYAALKAKLDPVMAQLKEYEKDTKKYKAEIADLKDQQAAVEKEMKALAKATESESNELAEYIKTAGENIQETIEQRITDIISGINFLYHEKINL